VSDASSEAGDSAALVPDATVGTYTWEDFLREFGHAEEARSLSRALERRPEPQSGGMLSGFGRTEQHSEAAPTAEEWETLAVDPAAYLGWHPTDFPDRVLEGAVCGEYLLAELNEWLRETPVTKGRYTWEHFKLEYYYDERGLRPREADGTVVDFEPEAYLGFDPQETRSLIEEAVAVGETVRGLEGERTVNVDPELDEDAFFSDAHGHSTVTNRYDLEQAVRMAEKPFLMEVERYWVDKPHAFVIVLHSVRENEKKYYLVGPHLNPTEDKLKEFLTGKLRTTIKYADEVVVRASVERRRAIISSELSRLLARYGLYEQGDATAPSLRDRVNRLLGREASPEPDSPTPMAGLSARPMPVVLEEESTALNEYQVTKLRYMLNRDFVGYGRIDGIKHDVSVEDISSDGYDSPVFVYHSEYEQLITNVAHGRAELDRFVIKLAQRSGKSISKRHPQVDATLPDGSRAQLTLGYEVSDHGTNYTIRQFNDVPFTPVDLINWRTFSLEEIVFLWLAIENGKSVLFAGGTASGKTTSLNAVSLFVPSSSKIVSIEDTREVELPQRNWIASITRPAFSSDDEGDIDEFDLLEAALRQRPEYILMGEVRGEEGRTLFQVMSTGHTTLTTFHADSVGEVLKRFTTDPINVSKTMFTALDLVSVQTQTRVKGQKIRRNKVITEINRYDSERDEINVRDIHKWVPDTDSFKNVSGSRLLEEITFDRGWDQEDLAEEMTKRRAVLAYLVKEGLNEYAQVAATIQAFINDPDAVLGLIARGELEASLTDLRNLESVLIDIDPEKEMLVPRPDPDARTLAEAESVLDDAASLFEQYTDHRPIPLSGALPAVEAAGEVVAHADGGFEMAESHTENTVETPAEEGDAGFEFGDGSSHDR
jgi:flagellar protein FlaI